MKLTKKQRYLYEKACKTLLFDDLYEFVITFWPRLIDTSKKDYLNYAEMRGEVCGLHKYSLEAEARKDFLESLKIGNLLMHLDWEIETAIHKAGLIQDVVRPREISKSYVRFLFEDRSIGYVIEKDQKKIPRGLRGKKNLESCFDIELVKKYFQYNKKTKIAG